MTGVLAASNLSGTIPVGGVCQPGADRYYSAVADRLTSA